MKKKFAEKIPHILSSFRNLLPEKTSDLERELLQNCRLNIEELSPDEFLLNFEISPEVFELLQSQIDDIEKNLKFKGDIIFSWFAGAKVLSVKVVKI